MGSKRSRQEELALALSIRPEAGRSFTLVVNIDDAEEPTLAADGGAGKRRCSLGAGTPDVPDAKIAPGALGEYFRAYDDYDAGSAYPSLMASPSRSERGAETCFGASLS